MTRAQIFARAHKMTKQYKRLGGCASYQAAFASHLIIIYDQLRRQAAA